MMWSVDSSSGDSDHCPILVTIPDGNPETNAELRNYKKSFWENFANCPAWYDIPHNSYDITIQSAINGLHE